MESLIGIDMMRKRYQIYIAKFSEATHSTANEQLKC